jgi:hypothetical protein
MDGLNTIGANNKVAGTGDVFRGSIIRVVSQHTWPFDHGRCIVTGDEITFRRWGSGWRHSRRDGPLRVRKYHAWPLVWQTVVWIDHSDRRRGFVPFRPKALLRSLEAHGWPVDLQPRR